MKPTQEKKHVSKKKGTQKMPKNSNKKIFDLDDSEVDDLVSTVVENNEPSTRQSEMRENHDRPKSWVPPSLLDAPKPPPGYHHRWIRYENRGVVDNKNISARFREGYEPVVRKEYPDWECPTIQDGRHAGTFTTGGLMLCRIPIEIVKQRKEYFDNRSAAADQAVDNDLLKVNDSRMPFDRSDRRSKVTFGRGRDEA